ncbi:DUF1624 domain-containing protein [Foetidibacter luteolus]|uniref:DUF1624 domain-containing protein n=1 Tax=Foetidibacter luteolus TaxID=2608880 RepID=UPI00129A27B6|nr:heparan-alpha-glucosaminide N-acetyltransferase domain-containing protein [Foetidibacter luteolus]
MQTTANNKRIQSVDFLRGFVMLIMALDHVRDFFHETAMTADPTDMNTTTPVLFFTRWITHFCAPTFVFLSGLSAYLAGFKKTKVRQSGFLIKRGLWLILVEMVVITFGLTFNPFYNSIIFQVIWAIGFSMVILGLLIRTSMKVIIAVGAALVLCHNIFDFFPVANDNAGAVLLNSLISGGPNFIPFTSNRGLLVFYTALPWTGLMLLGYAMGFYFTASFSQQQRKKILLKYGLLVVAFFVIVRFINVYGDPAHWSTQKNAVFTLLSFLNTTKYPPSLLYSCMTIGPSLIVLALTENIQGRFSKIVSVYGKVPFFYYLFHFYLIHTLCLIFFFASGYTLSQKVDPQQTLFWFRPANFGYSLPIVYLIWFCVIAVLYFPCRWFARYKQTHTQWWLSYL